MDSEISVTKLDSKNLPSVHSDDPEERKLARRLRVEARLKAVERQKAIADGTEETKPFEKPLVEETIETSEDTLQQLYLEGKELVTNIMVASDAKEVARREEEAEQRNHRLNRFQKEAALALEKLDEISNQWNIIMEINGPLELYQHMKDQKAKCLDLIEEKNNLIKSFQKELKSTDEKFMKGQKAMYEELALLTKRIDEQVLVMKRAYRLELNNIEDSVNISRKELLNEHQNTWLALYEKRNQKEMLYVDKKFGVVNKFEKFHEELHKLHIDHEEKYRATRIHYETDIQILEQELEEIKTLCLLNSEKLDYNYQVLKKRREENAYIKNHQKRRLNKLQDMLNVLKKQMEDKREAADEEYKKLNKDVKRYYANVLNIEKKAKLFARVNNEKFKNIWDMKDEEAKDLMEKILSVDMILHEQILGLNWTPPSTKFSKKDLLSYKLSIMATEFAANKKQLLESKTYFKSKNLRKEIAPEILEGHNRLLRHIFELIADQTGFLMEEKLDELLKPYAEDEKTFVRLDNVFVAIGIHTQKDIEEMKKVFIPYTVCLLCDRMQTSGTSIDYRVDDDGKMKDSPRQQSILQIRELEEKVSKLRIQAKKETENISYSLKDSFTEYSESRQNNSSRTNTLKEFGSLYYPKISNPPSDVPSESHSISDRRDSQLSLKENEMSINSAEMREAKCNLTHPLVIEKFFVLKALKDFVSAQNTDKLVLSKGIEGKLDRKRFTVSRSLTRKDIVSYWGKYRQIITSQLENRWNATFIALNKYLSLLQKRHNLNLEVKALRRQNLELKRLLTYYKVSDKEFKLPKVLPVPNAPITAQEMESILSKVPL